MSVRKRQWFTRAQVHAKARQLAAQARRPNDWREYQTHARALFSQCLRAARDKDKDALQALEDFPPQESWVVSYVDQQGRRVLKTFARKKEADAFAGTASVEVREGTHTADSASVTVGEAGKLWLDSAEAADLERTTIAQYRQHLRLHIEPIIGRTKLSQLNAPTIRAFEDRLRKGSEDKKKCSPVMVKYVVRSLGALLADAQERGLVVRNPVRELRRRRHRRTGMEERENGKPEQGVDIPTPDEIKCTIHAAKGRWRPLLLTAIFTGLRASELRGLRWEDLDLKNAKLNVRQRADRFNVIGRLKTRAAWRTVPLPPMIVNTLREWKLKCPKKDGKLWLCFPNGEGKRCRCRR